jgi:ArsR family transcriptional regulator
MIASLDTTPGFASGESAGAARSRDVLPCCTPLMVDTLDADDAAALATRFKAIADPVRLQILNRLAAAPDGVCVCDFVEVLDRSQPTISHHLKILAEAQLVRREQRGKWAWFSVVDEQITALRDALDLPG